MQTRTILREKTERMEGVLAGLAQIVGTDPEKIETYLTQALSSCHSATHDSVRNTYGWIRCRKNCCNTRTAIQQNLYTNNTT